MSSLRKKLYMPNIHTKQTNQKKNKPNNLNIFFDT